MRVWSQAIELNWTIITSGNNNNYSSLRVPTWVKVGKITKKCVFSIFQAYQISRVAYWNAEGIPHLIRICYEWICQFATSSPGVARHAIQCIVGGHTLYKWEGTHVLLRSTSAQEWVIMCYQGTYLEKSRGSRPPCSPLLLLLLVGSWGTTPAGNCEIGHSLHLICALTPSVPSTPHLRSKQCVEQ